MSRKTVARPPVVGRPTHERYSTIATRTLLHPSPDDCENVLRQMRSYFYGARPNYQPNSFMYREYSYWLLVIDRILEVPPWRWMDYTPIEGLEHIPQ